MSAIYISVPLAAVGVWFLILKTDYQRIEKIFPLRVFAVHLLYHFGHSGEARLEGSGHLQRQAGADAGYRIHHDADRNGGHFRRPMDAVFSSGRGCGEGNHCEGIRRIRIEVIVGCIVMSVIAFFIIVACAGAIWSNGPQDINDATDAALALKPFGHMLICCSARACLNASVFAACILPLSTAYSVAKAWDSNPA